MAVRQVRKKPPRMERFLYTKGSCKTIYFETHGSIQTLRNDRRQITIRRRISGIGVIHNTSLKKAGLLESVKRGVFRITERGYDVLDSGIEAIDPDFLMQFPEFVEFTIPMLAKTSLTETEEEQETQKNAPRDSSRQLSDLDRRTIVLQKMNRKTTN